MKKMRLKMIGIVFCVCGRCIYGYDDHSSYVFWSISESSGGPDHSDDQ